MLFEKSARKRKTIAVFKEIKNNLKSIPDFDFSEQGKDSFVEQGKDMVIFYINRSKPKPLPPPPFSHWEPEFKFTGDIYGIKISLYRHAPGIEWEMYFSRSKNLLDHAILRKLYPKDNQRQLECIKGKEIDMADPAKIAKSIAKRFLSFIKICDDTFERRAQVLKKMNKIEKQRIPLIREFEREIEGLQV